MVATGGGLKGEGAEGVVDMKYLARGTCFTERDYCRVFVVGKIISCGCEDFVWVTECSCKRGGKGGKIVGGVGEITVRGKEKLKKKKVQL